jgi:hypothetical protein
MKKLAGAVLAGIGLLSILSLAVSPIRSPSLPHFLGSYLPGLLFLFIGTALRVSAIERSRAAGGTDDADSEMANARAARWESEGNVGIVLGFATMLFGSGLTRQGPDYALAGMSVFIVGWLLLIYGCVNYAKWKDYSYWVGALGYLLLPGLLVLAMLPNRRKRLHAQNTPADQAPRPAPADEKRFGYRYAFAFAPIVLFYIAFAGFHLSRSANVDAAEWKDVFEPELGFQASVPGNVEREQATQPTPAGNVETQKFIAKPSGRKELFMIVSISFPRRVLDQIGGEEKVLEIGRQDVLTAVDGTLQSERPISLRGCRGLEVVVLPRKGAVVKSQMYVVGGQLYQLNVHVPKIRLSSTDVQKFFGSFRLFLDQEKLTGKGGGPRRQN